LPSHSVGETAKRWGYAKPDGSHDVSAGEIGVISSVTEAFCSDCNRARLTTEGQLYLCLFASRGYDLRTLLRNGSSDDQLGNAIANIWTQRSDQYSLLRQSMPPSPPGDNQRVEMSYIGG
jgi:GTP 3',8-cyclase